MTKWTATYLLLFPLTVYAQVDIHNTRLTDPQLTMLYRGIENTIEVSGLDKDTTLKLTSATGEVLESKWNNDPNLFFVKAGYADTDTLRLYQADSLVLTRTYEIKKIGNPISQLGDIADTTATIQQILENPKLIVVIPDCYYDHRYRVFYFRVTFLKATGDTLRTFDRTNGNQLTKAQTKTISDLKTGDKIEFTEITATCPNCVNRRLSPLTIMIK